MNARVSANAVGLLREAKAGIIKTSTCKEVVEPRDEVFARYQPIFHPDHIPNLTAEEFKSFLLFENNRHWTGLHRQSAKICADMQNLRKALSILLDESVPIDTRLDSAVQMVSGMGKNIATGILQVFHPNQYGVWNNRSEGRMKKMGIFPTFDRGESFGARYTKVNQVLLHLRDEIDTDLWTLDALWWYLDEQEEGIFEDTNSLETADLLPSNTHHFGLERHLQEFMRDNWDSLELSKEWELYKEAGDDEAGFEYPCAVGRIDLLARHRNGKAWLVIELKRNQTSDQTVGQLLRYVGWVKRHLAEAGEDVRGMIICGESDDSLIYAMSMVQGGSLMVYEVEFHLRRKSLS